MATITHIFVAPSRGAPMQPLNRVEALTEAGLVGDRYADANLRRGPDYQLTLIEIENIRAFEQATGHALGVDAPRRNIVTSGISLNDLVGHRFHLGPVLAQGLELCEPCALFRKRTHPEALRFFIGKGGLRARVLVGGVITIGDSICPEVSHGRDAND